MVPGQALYQTELHPEGANFSGEIGKTQVLGAGGTPPKTFLPRVSGSAEVWAGLALVTPFTHGDLKRMAGEAGFEPATYRLTAGRSAAELHPKMPDRRHNSTTAGPPIIAPRFGNMVRLRGCKSKIGDG